jgi:hypothetical protein
MGRPVALVQVVIQLKLLTRLFDYLKLLLCVVWLRYVFRLMGLIALNSSNCISVGSVFKSDFIL